MCFVWMSESVCDLLGIEPHWHYGKTREELLGEHFDADVWAPHLADLSALRSFRDFTYLRDAPGVEPIWIRVSGMPAHATDGSFQGYRGSGRNVTTEMHARHEAVAQGQRANQLADAIEQLNELLVLWDDNDRLVMCNAKFRDVNQLIASTNCAGTAFEDYVRAGLKAGLYPDALRV